MVKFLLKYMNNHLKAILTFISGSDRTNSPIDGSNMKPFTPCPADSTIIVALPYRAYPAAIICLCNKY